MEPQVSQYLFNRWEIIPPRNDVLWRIEHGAVRTLTWDEDGTFITLGYWGLEDLIGYPFSRIKPYQIECLIPFHEILDTDRFCCSPCFPCLPVPINLIVKRDHRCESQHYTPSNFNRTVY